MARAPGPSRWSRALAATLAGLAVGCVVAALILAAKAGWTGSVLLESFTATNGTMGVAFGVCGGILAWHRPRNPIGWLFVGCGLAHAVAALSSPLVDVLVAAGAPLTLQRVLLTVFVYSWPWSIALGLPLALLLFPDGRPPSPRWRPVVVAVAVTAPLFVVEMGAAPGPVADGLPPGYLTLPFYDRLQPLWTAAEVRNLVAILLGLVALGLRFRRGTETERRQLLWLLLAGVVMLVATIPWGLVAGTPVVVLFAIPLIPVAVTVAVVRYQLLDIRLVLARTLAWVLLSLGVLVAYGILVAVLDRFLAAQVGRSALLTVLLVLLAAPLLPQLQRLVDRALYGDRSNPARAVRRLGEQLSTAEAGLAGVVRSVRETLRLPYAAVRRDGQRLAESGDAFTGHESHTVPLVYEGSPVGELVVGLRPGERRLAEADRRVLGLLAAPVATAVHAEQVSAELAASRERIVAAQEEERRRLRRELHDGLGPTLTGIAFAADAAANFLDDQPDQSRRLLDTLRRDARTALGDVRRVADDLRPPALDELGLVGALRQRADQLTWRADGAAVRVRVEAPPTLPELPAAVEVAAYRIAAEALTNVVRHSRADTALVRLSCTDQLEVDVTDDGPPNGAWTPGVGLLAMRERAQELGGRLSAGPSGGGGRVWARLPLELAS